MEFPPAFAELIGALRQLPSVGPRSAERLALFLLEKNEAVALRLAKALTEARGRITPCPHCGFFAEGGLCPICADPSRDTGLLCVVEHANDILKFEKSGGFKGRYHALGGRLSPLDGIGPEQLRIAELLERTNELKPREVILALSADVEGETTSLYLSPLLKERGARVTRLATGLPAGGGLDYVDSVTLGYALSGRREI